MVYSVFSLFLLFFFLPLSRNRGREVNMSLLLINWLNKTGHLTPKSDVYSFGVVLLELLSGRRAMADDRAGFVEETLVDWAKPFLSDSKRVLRIMDIRLGGQYSKKGAQAAAALAVQCLHTDPKNRPPMVNVLATLERLPTSNIVPRTTQPTVDHHRVKHLSNSR
jgi:serine/threonine protein kinase